MITQKSSDAIGFVLEVFAEVLRQLPGHSVELSLGQTFVNSARTYAVVPGRQYVLMIIYPNRRYTDESYIVSGYLVQHEGDWVEAALDMSDLDDSCSRVHVLRQADGSLSVELGEEPWIFFHDVAAWS